jgi:hypothetical protein
MDLKSVSLQDLENAITQSTRELLSDKYEVTIEKLDFEGVDARTADLTPRIHEQKYKPGELSESSER